MKKIVLIAFLVVFGWFGLSCAADVELAWDASSGATGYRLYMLTGITDALLVDWTAAVMQDVGNVTNYTWVGVPDAGLTIWRVSAYNANGETIKFNAGAWFNPDWGPPPSARGLGIE